MPYAELHCHSNFSFLDGASHIEELVLSARELKYEALALTDHDGLYGAMEFAQCARAWGLKPITGAEVTLSDQSRQINHHLTLLCETERGYANLCRLLTHAHLDHERGNPCIEPEELARHTDGLIAFSGCRNGQIPLLIAQGRYPEACEVARRYMQQFGPGNFFIELQSNLSYGDARRNRALVDLAEHLKLGIVATGDVHYHTRERYRLQDVLVAIKNRSTLDTSHHQRRGNSEYYLTAPAEMEAQFKDFPEAVPNTARIAERCEFDLSRDLSYQFPDYPVPPGETPDSYLQKLCYRELRNRYARITPEAEKRLGEELALVQRRGLSGFFLVHHEILQLARRVAEEVRGRPSHGPPGRGRGSSVGSLICYLIGLSHIDPIQNNLYIGRFIHEEMGSVPDIDLDFSRDIREKLILRIYEHFGNDHVGLVATFPTYRIRSAIREVGKALGLPPAELDRLAKVSEGGSAKTIGEEMSRLPHYKDKTNSPLWRHLIELAEQIAGFPRHISQHVGGMVISSKPLIEMVPMEQSAMEGRLLIQWDKDSVDDAHMIKIDFLALGMLSAVDETLDLIEQHHGKSIDLSRINFKDARVYDSICAADTMGVFQIESRAQMQTLPRTRPRSLEELTVEVAIIRPGPIVGGSVNPYINRRLGREPVTYDHPSLKSVLEETLGVILFQEQVLQVSMVLAGFSAGEADGLRRAMSRKRSKEALDKLKDQFIAGCLHNGLEKQAAAKVFKQVVGFAEFGFPKAHAAAFGLLAYQTAWLRLYYPAESLCALFNAQPMGFYGPHVLVNDDQRHGVDVLPPDINLGGANCTLDGDGVRIGFGYVKRLSDSTAREVEMERNRNGPYRSVFDFIERTRLKQEQIENLIAGGAFDSFGLERRELIWQLGLIYRSEGRGSRQHQLALSLPIEQDMVRLPPMTGWDRMAADYAILGLSPTSHPMFFIRAQLNEGIVPSRMLESLPDGALVNVAGLVVCRQRPGTAKGFVFLVLEDEYGLVNLVVKPGLHDRQRSLVRTEPFVIVQGTLQRRDGTVNVIAGRFSPLRPNGAPTPEAHNFGHGHR